MAHLRGNDTTGREDEEPQMTELARNCWLTESECPDFPSITGKCWFSSTNSVKVYSRGFDKNTILDPHLKGYSTFHINGVYCCYIMTIYCTWT